ncbi:MAG: AI-2E family transporter [Acidobacteriota bacterium]|jgi:predicted PurR-regulated permease PerM
MDAPSSLLDLGPRQRAAIAAALTILAVVVILGAVLGMGWVLSQFVSRFSHVFLPLALGWIGSLVCRPYYGWLRARLKLPPGLALAVVFLSVLAPLGLFGWFFGALAVRQISDLLSRIPEWWEAAVDGVRDRWPQVQAFFTTNPWGQRIRAAFEGQQGAVVEGLQSVGGRALSAGGNVLRGIGAGVAWVVLPVYFSFFLLMDWKIDRPLEKGLPFLKPETRKDVVYLVRQFVDIMVAFFRGQLLIAGLQGVLFAAGFSLVGLRYGFVLGLALGFLNIIPYLGSLIGLGIGLPLAYFQEGGGLILVGLVLAVFTAVQLIEGYFLTPRIMGDRTGLHPMAIIVAVFFWGSALQGILGMILAIPLTAFLVVFWRLAREKYIGELV